ncbi:MAG: YcgN family cysteine cluster protein [Natronospirillum sp.]
MTDAQPFWQTKTLSEMSRQEWESLCDGCAKCCLQKLEDDDTNEVYYTRVVCRYLDSRCQCKIYDHRQEKVPNCIWLQPGDLDKLAWLPDTCSYRLIHEGKNLPRWHPLRTGKATSTVKKGQSVQQWPIIPDDAVPEDEWEDHIIFKVT